jgi:hypothetical protein
MLMALMGGGSGQQTGQANAMSTQANPLMQQPLMNGQNASLGAATGASLATPQDMMMNSMMQPVPQQ